MTNLKPVTRANLEKVLEAPAVVVDFWAEWCAPCKALAPILKRLGEELKGRLVVVGANVEEAQDLADRFAIASVPAIVFFRDGQEVHRIVGAVPRAKLRDDIRDHLGV